MFHTLFHGKIIQMPFAIDTKTVAQVTLAISVNGKHLRAPVLRALGQVVTKSFKQSQIGLNITDMCCMLVKCR